MGILAPDIFHRKTISSILLLGFLSSLFSIFVLFFIKKYGIGEDNYGKLGFIDLFIGAILISPIIEALLIALIFCIFNKFFGSIFSAIMAGLIMAFAHGIYYWLWGIISIIPFLIFSLPFSFSYIKLSNKIVMSALIHSISNLIVILFIYL